MTSEEIIALLTEFDELVTNDEDFVDISSSQEANYALATLLAKLDNWEEFEQLPDALKTAFLLGVFFERKGL